VGIASLVALPSLAVLASLAHPAHEIWSHLWRTQLSELIGNTLALVAGSRGHPALGPARL